MTTNEQETQLRERILARIETGTLRMRPRVYFTGMAALTVALAGAVFLFSAFILSYILFMLTERGEHFLLSFGPRGFLAFLALFPWTYLALDLIAIFALRALLKRFRAVYRVSYVPVIIALTLLSTLAAVGITFTPVHRSLRERADADDLPLIGPWYADLETPREEYGEFRGTVTHIEDRMLTIFHDDRDRDQDDGERRVHVPEPTDITVFRIGDEVYVFGEWTDGVIEAYGVRKMPARHDEEDEEEDDSSDELE